MITIRATAIRAQNGMEVCLRGVFTPDLYDVCINTTSDAWEIVSSSDPLLHLKINKQDRATMSGFINWMWLEHNHVCTDVFDIYCMCAFKCWETAPTALTFTSTREGAVTRYKCKEIADFCLEFSTRGPIGMEEWMVYETVDGPAPVHQTALLSLHRHIPRKLSIQQLNIIMGRADLRILTTLGYALLHEVIIPPTPFMGYLQDLLDEQALFKRHANAKWLQTFLLTPISDS